MLFRGKIKINLKLGKEVIKDWKTIAENKENAKIDAINSFYPLYIHDSNIESFEIISCKEYI